MDKSLLNKAITPNEDPTPGWMFHTIAKWTRDFSACQKVEDYLLKKLATDNPHVKRKVLIIIKNVAIQGDTQFAQSLARKSEEIKKYTAYKGPVDPMHGDALNLQVRTAASQAMEAVFKRTESKGTGGMGFMEGNQGIQGPIMGKDPSVKDYTGFGSNTTNTPQQQPSSGFGVFNPQPSIPASNPHIGSMNSKYKGLGNPNFAQPAQGSPSQPQTWTEWTSEKASAIGSYFVAKKPYEGTFDPSTQYQTNWLNQESGTYTAPAIGNTKPGSTFFSPNDVAPQGAKDWEIQQQASNSTEYSGVHEAKIVDEFCTGVGVKVAPTRQELSQFVTRCSSVNSEVVAEKLAEKLENPSWQIKLKALHAIEALVKAKNQQVIDFFSDNMEDIQAQTVATQETLAQKAQKVISVLTKTEMPATETKKKKPIAKPVMKPQSQQEDILFDIGQDNPSTPPVNNTKADTSILNMDDMFSNMTVSQPTQPVNQTGVGSTTDLDDIFSSQPARKRTTSSPQAILNMIPSNTTPTAVPVVPVRGMPTVVTPVAMPMYTVAPAPYVQYIVAPTVPVVRPVVPMQKPMPAATNTGSGFDFMGNQEKDGFDFIKTEIMGKK